MQLKVLPSTDSRLAREMGNGFFVIGVNNMISIILILTLYFFNVTSKYSNCICHHFTAHNCIKHKSSEFVGKLSVTFLRSACVRDIQCVAVPMWELNHRNQYRDSGVSKEAEIQASGAEVLGLNGRVDLKYY